MEKLVSIIIPHYNRPGSLRRLLDTIPVREEIQVIVVDDLSTKDLEEYNQIVEEYGARVEFYTNTIDNKSAGGARNVGLKKAVGKWLLFADSDDYFADNMWEKISMYFESSSDIIYFFPSSIDENTGLNTNNHMRMTYCLSQYLIAQPVDKKRAEAEVRMNCIVPWSKLIRRSLVTNNNIEFDVVKYSNDLMFSVKTGFTAAAIEVSEQIIYYYVKGSDTLYHNSDPMMKEIRDKVFAEYQSYCAAHLEGNLGRRYRRQLRINKMKNKINSGTIFSGLYRLYRNIRYKEQ